MIFARNVLDGSIVLEAFEFGVDLPFVRSAKLMWRPEAVAIETLRDDYVDIRENSDECRRMIEEAREVASFILSELDIERDGLAKMSLGTIRARLARLRGTDEINISWIRSGDEMDGLDAAEVAAVHAGSHYAN